MNKRLTNVGRDGLLELIRVQEKQIEELEFQLADLHRNLILKGWWCVCDMFNGEEKEIRTECRSCGKPKTVRPLKMP